MSSYQKSKKNKIPSDFAEKYSCFKIRTIRHSFKKNAISAGKIEFLTPDYKKVSGDLIISRNDDIGTVRFIYDLPNNNHMDYIINAKKMPYYFYWYLQCPECKKWKRKYLYFRLGEKFLCQRCNNLKIKKNSVKLLSEKELIDLMNRAKTHDLIQKFIVNYYFFVDHIYKKAKKSLTHEPF